MKTKTQLQIAWTDLSWEVHIRNRYNGGCRLDHEILRLVRSRFEPFALPPEMYRAGPVNRSRSRPGGFTLVELLVVIAIIAILAGILLPTLANVKTRAKVASARSEMMGLVAAIKAYEGDYNRNPASPQVEQAAASGDFTFGTKNANAPASGDVVNPPHPPPVYDANNSEIVLILLDIDQGPANNPNANHLRNPRKVKYWNPKMVSNDAGGVSASDYVARDPWGMPYIITVDMNDDNKCVDAFYSTKVSERVSGDPAGYYGLTSPGVNKPFELNGPVMIWSFGPDRNYDPASKANAGANKDNVLSWSN